MIWDTDSAEWHEKCYQVEAFVKKWGEWPNKQAKFKEDKDLATALNIWCSNQLAMWKGTHVRDTLTVNPDRVERLKSIDFPFDGSHLMTVSKRKQLAFDKNIKLLRGYFSKNGHINIPRHELKSSNCPGGSFPTKLRKDVKDGKQKLTKELKKELEIMGLWKKAIPKGSIPQLHVMTSHVDYKSKTSQRTEKFTQHIIHLRKKIGVGEKPVVVTYRCKKAAEKACKFLQDKLDSNCKESNKELRELVYEKVPRPKQAKWGSKK